MKKFILNKKWYSVIISLLLIWFLIVLSIWIFRLILNEMKSNKAMWDYIKSYAWAESSQELALLEIKIKGYWYDTKILDNKEWKSIILSKNFLDNSLYHPKKDVLISNSNDWKVNSYDWKLKPLWYDIIPLFYLDDTWEKKVNNIDFLVKSWDSGNLSWNVIWKLNWISWVWSDLTGIKKTITSLGFTQENKTIWEFLNSSSTNYLVLFNSWNTWDIDYKLSTNISTEFFTKPRLTILSSWEVWDYKQNLQTIVDNTEFLNILKYSIYSN